ncbi:MAG: hypothetical protein BWY67_01344 [Bacteroidetes bacterium ADurb.Bin397]|nr:MAG: hypothetical protein BWY67_01344 [Bacteroidetes bacterium ADurb.Bin397]
MTEVFAPMVQLIPVVHFQLFIARVKEATASTLAARFELMLNVYPPVPLRFCMENKNVCEFKVAGTELNTEYSMISELELVPVS